MKKSIFIFLFFLIIAFCSPELGFTQINPVGEHVEMADKFRQEGKIYVVLAIIGVTMAGFFFYVIRLDQKISKLENEFEHLKR